MCRMENHLSDELLERYHLGTVPENDLAAVEAHILCCPYCAVRAEAAANYVDLIRVALCRIGY